MKPDPRFLNLPKDFWANVRLISQEVGYTIKGQGEIKVPSLTEIQKAFAEIALDVGHLADTGGGPTPYGKLLLDYFACRATMLREHVEPMLMTAEQAKYRSGSPVSIIYSIRTVPVILSWVFSVNRGSLCKTLFALSLIMCASLASSSLTRP
jgi:hypothetical protein